LPCDIFLASHGSFFHFVEKHERLLAGDAAAFIDPVGYKRYLRDRKQEFRDKLVQQEAAHLSCRPVEP
jgi:metallo-beta-lactamase class B